MRIRRTIISLLLCASLIAGAALPAFAYSDYDVHSEYHYSIGVSSRCTSSIDSSEASAKLTLSYLPDPTNHWPANDYSIKANIIIFYGNVGLEFGPTQNTNGMYTMTKVTDLFSGVTNAWFLYYLNSSTNTFYTHPNNI